MSLGLNYIELAKSEQHLFRLIAAVDDLGISGDGEFLLKGETGDLSKKVPVVKKMNTDIGGQTWYAMYSKMEYLGASRNIKSNMIPGSMKATFTKTAKQKE